MSLVKKSLQVCAVLALGSLAPLISGCAATISKPATTPKTTGGSGTAARTVAAKPAAQPADGPSPVVVDIGECFEYRYSTNDRCSANNDLDCQKAVADSDCGITNGFVYTNSWCQYNDSTFYKYHVMCQGYQNTGPMPQPQCADDQATGTWILSGSQAGCEVGTCTINCNAYCPGGYCTGGGYNLCYWGYAPRCDCGTVTCPCTGPDCNGDGAKKKPPFYN